MAQRTRINRRHLTSHILAIEFEEIVQELLKLNGFRVTQPEKQQPFDFQATQDNVVYAVEVKHYRTERAQPSLLQAAALQLLSALERGALSKGMLITSCTLYPELRESLENRFGLIFGQICSSGEPRIQNLRLDLRHYSRKRNRFLPH